MATSRELLEQWVKNGNVVDEEVVDSLFKMKGLTDELAEQRFLEKYGDRVPFYQADKIEDPTIPSIQNVIAILGLEDDPKDNPNIKNPRTKEQKFIEDFPKKLSDWKKKIENNKVYGKRGWETVKEIWRQAEHQKMIGEIAKARRKAMDDAPLDYGLFQLPNIPGSSFITKVMFPRATEHIANTGDFTTKDILADIAENAAMSIPGAKFTSWGAKGLSKLAPRLITPAKGTAGKVLQRIGGMGGNIAGNAVVPFASEGLDAAIYDDTDTGMEHRADFSWGDALLGTAINQGVNRGLLRLIGPAIDKFSPGGMARGGMGKAREFLSSLGQPMSTKGDEFANRVRATDNVLNIRDKGNLRPEDIRNFELGLSSAPANVANEAEEAVRKANILNAIDNGEISLYPKEAIEEAARVNHESTIKILKDAADANNAEMEKLIQRQTELQGKLDGMPRGKNTTEEAKLVNEISDTQLKLDELRNKQFNLNNALQKDYRQTNVLNIFDTENYANKAGSLPENSVYQILDNNTPEFINYTKWHGPQGPGRSDRILDAVAQGIPSYATNKYGSETDADLLLAQMPAVKKALKEDRKETKAAPKKRNTANDILSVVNSTPELTEKDKKYLNAIAANPDILKYGYPEDSAAFKIWLLERGNDLLQGTSAFRPTFDVE